MEISVAFFLNWIVFNSKTWEYYSDDRSHKQKKIHRDLKRL